MAFLRFAIALAVGIISMAKAYVAMSSYIPSHPRLHGKIINAKDKGFVIGAPCPTTYCDVDDAIECPDGSSTLVNNEMTHLASSVPGGQFIYVAPSGLISYPSAHTSLRPPGSEIGGFYSYEIDHSIEILSWRSDSGASGLWACPLSPGRPVTDQAVLKASTDRFSGKGCISVEGIRIEEAGDEFSAWAYA